MAQDAATELDIFAHNAPISSELLVEPRSAARPTRRSAASLGLGSGRSIPARRGLFNASSAAAPTAVTGGGRGDAPRPRTRANGADREPAVIDLAADDGDVQHQLELSQGQRTGGAGARSAGGNGGTIDERERGGSGGPRGSGGGRAAFHIAPLDALLVGSHRFLESPLRVSFKDDAELPALAFDAGAGQRFDLPLSEVDGCELGRNETALFCALRPKESWFRANRVSAAQRQQNGDVRFAARHHPSFASPSKQLERLLSASGFDWKLMSKTRIDEVARTLGLVQHQRRTRASLAATSASAEIFIVYSPLGVSKSERVTLTEADVAILRGKETFLNDSLIDFWLAYVLHVRMSPALRQRIHIFSSFFFTRMSTAAARKEAEDQRRVHKWTKSVDVFTKDFVVVPINEHLHWKVAIVCYPGLPSQGEVVAMERLLANARKGSQSDTSAEAMEGALVSEHPGAVMLRALDLLWGVVAWELGAAFAQQRPGLLDKCRLELPSDTEASTESDEESKSEGDDGAGAPAPLLLPALDSPALPARPASAPAPPPASDEMVDERADPAEHPQSKRARIATTHAAAAARAPMAAVSAPTLPTSLRKSPRLRPAPARLRPRPQVRPAFEPKDLETLERAVKLAAAEHKAGHRPEILMLDSLNAPNRTAFDKLRTYLASEWAVKRGTQRRFSADLVDARRVPDLPKQENSYDCGLFLLRFVECFFARSTFNVDEVHIDFPQREIRAKREEILNVVEGLRANNAATRPPRGADERPQAALPSSSSSSSSPLADAIDLSASSPPVPVRQEPQASSLSRLPPAP
jgi:Ulp1 family protease